ncbi:cytochrome c biogenesis CcdA family protein [Tenggerimyces flavus]|uniref:cytochrome c biogenesis CcdA family protein n=1 Tax=Tenggerimyces flavus TaxID=1708749 RepID=UPI0027D9F75F|nr:cytochrome c biogenesis protein CcdA [Tenggerimyces flavus]
MILSFLGLPDNLLRWAGLTVLVLVGLGLIVPALAHLIEKPFYRLPKVTRNANGAFVLGLGLGTLFVPCASPVLAAITVAGATGQIGWRTVVLTVSFAIGAALPLLIFTAAGSRIARSVGEPHTTDNRADRLHLSARDLASYACPALGSALLELGLCRCA